MKIIYLTQYAVDGQNQSQFFNYSRLISSEFDVKVYYLFKYDADNKLIADYKKSNVAVNSLEFGGPRISLRNFIRFVKEMARQDVDIIHSQHPIAGFYNKVGTTFVNVFYRKKIKIIVEQRCVKKNLSFFAQVLETVTHPLADLVICSSDSVELSYFNKVNFLDDFLNGNKKHITFYNSIDISSFENSEPKAVGDLKLKPVVTICMIGRNEPVKQPIMVLEAIKLLTQQYNIRFLIAGHGSLDEQMKSYVEENGLQETVTFLGNISWVPKLLSESDIYINYSKHEGLCKSLLESMAVGTAAIASRVEGNIEVIGLENEYGILEDSTSSKKLSEAIVSMITDFNLFKKYSEIGKERIKKFDVGFQIKNIEKIYKKIKHGA